MSTIPINVKASKIATALARIMPNTGRIVVVTNYWQVLRIWSTALSKKAYARSSPEKWVACGNIRKYGYVDIYIIQLLTWHERLHRLYRFRSKMSTRSALRI